MTSFVLHGIFLPAASDLHLLHAGIFTCHIWSCHLTAVPKVALNTRLFRPSFICSSGGIALYSGLCQRSSATCSLVTCVMWSSYLSHDVFCCTTCPDMGVFLPVISDKRSPPATYPTYMYVPQWRIQHRAYPAYAPPPLIGENIAFSSIFF